MLIALEPEWGGGGVLRAFADDGTPSGDVARYRDAAALAAAVRAREQAESPRWLWASTAETYPPLLAAGVRVARCHDLELVEGLLSGYEGRWGEPRSLAAALARQAGLPVPADPPPRQRDAQPALFAFGAEGESAGLIAVSTVYRAQRDRIGRTEHPDRMRLLAAIESAGALAGAEMGHDGLPWSVERHNALLVEQLGPRPLPLDRPRRLIELAAQVSAAFGGRKVNPDTPADVVRAFRAAGVQVPSARSWVLRRVEHPAVEPLLAYKELSRLYSAHGWHWQETWVSGGRLRPEYVPGGVVSGRWATRGGAALQLPRIIRQAVVADPGWKLVVADAGQLEPRILAALSGDRRLAAAAAAGDLYAALAADAFGGDRARAKLGLLGALYGQTSGEGGRLMHVLRKQYPDAIGMVDAAARDGEHGLLVRSRLGRTCPPVPAGWPGEEGDAGEADARRAARGRFTRNFLVQATAAEWASAVLAGVRRRLDPVAPDRPRLVFFQHDEVVVHCRLADAAEVTTAIGDAVLEATALLFGPTPVRFPVDLNVVDSYADKGG